MIRSANTNQGNCRPRVESRYRRHRASAEFRHESILGSCNDLLVSDALAHHAVNKGIKALVRVDGDVASVQTEGSFIDVPAKVLRADMVPDTVNTPLEDSPNRLDTIRVRRAANVLLAGMVYGFVAEEKAVQVAVSAKLIGVELRPDFDIGMDDALDRVAVHGVEHKGLGSSALPALLHADNRRLTDAPAPRLELLRFVLIALKSTDKGFVDLDDSTEFVHVEPLQASLRR